MIAALVLAAALQQSYPPECITVNVAALGSTWSGVQFCGDGGLDDSPVRDSERGDTWQEFGGAAPTITGPATIADRDDPPGPQVCTAVNISENSGAGPVLRFRFCGESNRPVWAAEAGDTWVVDGGPLTSGAVVLDVK